MCPKCGGQARVALGLVVRDGGRELFEAVENLVRISLVRVERIPIALDILELIERKPDLKRDEALRLLRRIDGFSELELPEGPADFRRALKPLAILLKTTAFGLRSGA